MIVNYRDITDRVEAVDRLWEQQELYRAIVEAVSDGILMIDSEGRIVTANKAACEMHGYGADEMIGKTVKELVRPADHSKLDTFTARTSAGSARYVEAIGLRKDRSEVHVVMHGTSFLLDGVAHLLAVVSNVSEQKRLQQRLERADRISSLGRLAATIAHEMNNVMMGILPFTEIIRRRGGSDPMIQNASTHIMKSVERGKVVTQGILQFTRATGKPELLAIDAHQFIDSVTDELRNRLRGTITLEVSCEENLRLLGDDAQLQQVVMNLVMNSQDAISGAGRVGVRLSSCSPEAFAHFGGGGEKVNAYAHLCVSDTGQGIPPYLMGQIFEPLFTTKGSGGTGLGLAIVHQIVIAHEGQIHVQSEPGRGTTFHVLLRKAEPQASQLDGSEGSDQIWRRVRSVILVEDEPSVGEGIAAILRMEGVQCEWLMRGDAALERLRAFRPDLLLLDVGLPDMSGIDVYRQAAQLYPDLPTVFSTGHGDHRLLDELDPAAPVGFLSKPYSLETLTRRVRSLIDTHGLRSTG